LKLVLNKPAAPAAAAPAAAAPAAAAPAAAAPAAAAPAASPLPEPHSPVGYVEKFKIKTPDKADMMVHLFRGSSTPQRMPLLREVVKGTASLSVQSYNKKKITNYLKSTLAKRITIRRKSLYIFRNVRTKRLHCHKMSSINFFRQ
jgi:curli biogenesis system outer membrane secretion channel CsgG